MSDIINYSSTSAQLPSPPLSPYKKNDKTIDIENFNCTDKVLKNVKNALGSPVEYTIEISKNEILRSKYMKIMEEGIEINNEMTPYPYVIQKLHSIGSRIINKKTKDAVPLRVYETGKDCFEEFWVHPFYLSLQSFQFYKLFEEIRNNNEQGIIEIEVPSLKTFALVLYFLYTGDISKVLEVGKLDENLCKGIIENINCLEINMTSF
ncbi:hypothetical protein H8356DRAFT_1659585 [Neocallimastix lanati (nom. inval.)]|nr:hypothetical protein H8356DRAFT_1659585 [Neocallimastix sp. JGI-2020a]